MSNKRMKLHHDTVFSHGLYKKSTLSLSQPVFQSLEPLTTANHVSVQYPSAFVQPYSLPQFCDLATNLYHEEGYRCPIVQIQWCQKVGCHLCTLIICGLGAIKSSTLFEDIILRQSSSPISVIQITIPGLEPSKKYEIYWSSHESNKPCLRNLRLPPCSLQDFPKLGPRFDVSEHSGSLACTVRALRWLKKCIEDHPLCSISRFSERSSTMLPKRVIDVDQLRVCEFNSAVATNNSYIALSHCWGSSQTYKAEKRSIEHRMKSLQWRDIPKTFQDAILTTHSLGFRYLWIDSLCIIQDDEDDWAMESSKMSHIYANAILTIAAAAAKDDTQGFLHGRDHIGTAIAFSGENLAIKIREDIHHNRATTGPLVQRAWVFQERLLSRRILFYEEHEMVWECRMARMCECSSDLDHSTYRVKMNDMLFDEPDYSTVSLLGAYKFTQTNRANSETYRWWRGVVTPQYSRLQLTKPTDRLPALSGLAAAVQQKTQDKYLAGLWLSDLTRGLLWKPSTIARFPDVYLAPSWSWASVHGHITYRKMGPSDVSFEVIDTRIEQATVDPTGAVRCGELQLRCPVIPTTLQASRPKNWYSHVMYALGAELRTVLQLDTPITHANVETLEGRKQTAVRSSKFADPAHVCKVYFALIAKESSADRVFPAGIILGHSASRIGMFERLGTWEGVWPSTCVEHLQSLMMDITII